MYSFSRERKLLLYVGSCLVFLLNPSGHTICVISPGNLIGCAAHFFRRIFYSNTDACPADHIDVIFRISKSNGCLLWNLQIICQKSKGGRFPCFFIRYFQQGWHGRSQIGFFAVLLWFVHLPQQYPDCPVLLCVPAEM